MRDAPEEFRKRSDGWAWAALAALVAAAAAARAWLLWSTPLVPGMNGGYYLIQSRALLEHGRLGIPDLPLAFLVQAGFAKLLQVVTGRGLEASILTSVRLCDALLPPLVAVPVFLLGRTWCRQAGRAAWPALAAAALAALGLPALSMTGDFEKNSLGLVWLAALVVALHAWMAQRTRGRAAAVVGCLGLCGLTHIGVFGAALTLTALTGVADLALLRGKEGLKTLRHVAAVALAGAAAAALVAGLVLWKFDPARVRRLAGALSHPVVFLQTGGHADGQGGAPGRFAPPPGMMPPGGADRGRGRMPGPPGMLPEGVADGLFLLTAAGALALPLRRRRALPAADRAATIGCAVTLALLAGPWVQGDVVMRLRLIAMIPAAFAAAFALAHLPGRLTAPACSAALLALVAATSLPLVQRGGHPTIDAEALDELRTLTQFVAQPDRTLVVARHGLEWWTAWALHTHVAQARAVRAADWANYDAVFFIQERGGRGAGHPGFRRPEGGPRGEQPRSDFRGGPPPGFGGPAGAPPMMEAAIPEGAEIVHNGKHFTLARVSEPPASFADFPDAPPAR